MTGVLIKVWDLSLSGKEVSLLIPLETSIEETVQELVGWGTLSAWVDQFNVDQTREVVGEILAGIYSYTWDTDLGLRMRGNSGADIATAAEDDDSPDYLNTKIKSEVEDDLLEVEEEIKNIDVDNILQLEVASPVKREKLSGKRKKAAKGLVNKKIKKNLLQQPYICEINCSLKFTSKKQLEKHHRMDHPEFYCKQCFTAFLHEHNCPKKLEKLAYRCDIDCDEAFTSRVELTKHQRINHKDAYCPQCSKAFLGEHSCPKQVIIRCDINCSQEFRNKLLLKLHQREAHKEYYCSPCGKAFLTDHTCKLFKCEVCGRDFKGRNVLRKHILIHTGEKPHVCDTCGRKFTQKVTLTKHVKFVHSELKRFPCDECGAEFKHENYLVDHKKFVHSGVVENICDICSRTFILRRHLLNHIRVTHEDKSLFCPVCEKGFSFPNELRRHMPIHGDKKSHVCEVCNMGFYKRHSLQKHMKCVHGEKKFVCDVCKIGFTTNYYLTRHRQSHKLLPDLE